MEADYQKYVKTLPQNDQKFILTINFFEDGTGQHAAKILIDSNGTEWSHVLIYNKEYKRIKTIKYESGYSPNM